MDLGTIPKLTKHQNYVLGLLIDKEAEIQVTTETCRAEYDLVYDNGNIETLKSSTFKKLRDSGLIKRQYNPSIYAERWF